VVALLSVQLARLQTVELDLSSNDLNGTLPLEFYNATGRILLNNNSLTGPLPYFLETSAAQFSYGGNNFCSNVVGELCGNVTDSYILRTLRVSAVGSVWPLCYGVKIEEEHSA
jgi:hypothetical protein